MPHSPEVSVSSHTYEEALAKALKAWGVEGEYYDIWGNHHVVSQPVATSILKSLGVEASSREEIDEALRKRLWSEWTRPLPATLVASVAAKKIPINIPEDRMQERILVTYLWEQGAHHESTYLAADLTEESSAVIEGRRFVRRSLPLPAYPPLGYHRVRVEIGGEETEASLILCPDRAYYPEHDGKRERTAGIAVSLYGVRSERNWGCGDFDDLEELARWAHDQLGASFISLNPLHAIPNRQPYNTSPYLPMCSFYKNPLYIDIEALEDYRLCEAAQRIRSSDKVEHEIAALRESKYVEYERVWRLKLRFLKLLFRRFLQAEYYRDTDRAHEFRLFVDAEGMLLDRYAVYSALDAWLHKKNPNLWIWPDWPERYRDPDSPAVRAFADTHWRSVLLYKWIQWQLELQLEAAHQAVRRKGLSIGLYHDLALATDRCGGDLWAYRPFYTHGCRVGAPPDSFSPKGQDWAFPPPNTVRHRDDGYRLFADSIRRNLKHGGALRIDHVMRFFRLYWIPEGHEATEGTYVRENHEDLLHILALESVRNKVIIVGEDLGTVEPYIREILQRFGILSYRLLYFERDRKSEFKLPSEYPQQALISVSTHDLPTLAGFWTNRDIDARREAGLLHNHENYRQQIDARTADKQKLLDLMFRLNLLPDFVPRSARDIPEFTGELHNAVVAFLAKAPSELMCLNQEDLLKDLDQQNLPGSTEQYPNWRHKMRFTLEELRADPLAIGCAAMFRHWVADSGRLSD